MSQLMFLHCFASAFQSSLPMASLSKSTSSSSDEDGDLRLRRGPWTAEEDSLLIHNVACHGEGRWNLLAKRSGLRRTGKSCRLRWLNYLKPDVKRGNLTPQEQILILELHSRWGNRWSKIAQHLPGRTDNEIKNYWRTRVEKQARHLKIDSDSTAFQEVIRRLWMPRLLQKIQGPLPSLDVSFQSSSKTQPLDHDASKPAQVAAQETTLDNQMSFSSSESVNVSQIPQALEYEANPFHAMANTDFSPIFKGPYGDDNIGHGLETFSPAADPMSGCFSGGNNWIDNDLVDNWWSMEELWQFMQLQERGS